VSSTVSEAMPIWDIRNEGRAWGKGEAMARYLMTSRKMEMAGGKLMTCDEDRETLLCLLLENVGADRAVQFGAPDVRRRAVAKLEG
jgi:hypothetical protein